MCGRKQHLRKGENATYGKGDANTFLYSPMFYSILSTALPFCCSFAQTYLTLCGPMDCSMPGFPVLHHLLELAQTHVHQLVMPSNHLIFCHLLLLLPSVFPSIRGFSNESALCIRWAKYWSFSFSISPSV